MATADAVLVPRTRKGTPRITTTDQVIDYWAERLTRTIKGRDRENCERNSLIMHGDSLFHYGRHFELARILRSKSGQPIRVLLNGDSYPGASGFGPSTGQRQMQVRDAVKMHGDGIEAIVVPFGVLRAAGADINSVRPIHVLADREEVTEHSSIECPGDFKSRETGETETLQRERRIFSADYRTSELVTEDYERSIMEDDPTRAHVDGGGQHGYSRDGATLGDDGVWRWVTHTHKLGESLFRAKVTELRYFSTDAAVERGGRPGSRSVARWATFLSSFDYNERHRPYFMCELPYGAKPSTIEEAIECLIPDEVRAARDAGLEILRQGDIFAIPTAYTDKDLLPRAIPHDREDYSECWKGAEYTPPVKIPVKIRSKKLDERDAQVLGTNHAPTHAIITKDGAFGRGRMYHSPAGRGADHRTIDLGDRKTWYRLVKNTVPLAKTGRNSQVVRGFGNAGINFVNQSQSRAWMVDGQVD